MKRATTAAIATAVSMAFAGPAWATPEPLSEAQLDAVVAGSAYNFNGNKILSGNDVNVLNGNNTAVGVGILGTGAIAVDDGDKHHAKNGHGDKHHGKHDRGDKHHAKNDRGDKHHAKNDHGKHHAKNDHGGKQHHVMNERGDKRHGRKHDHGNSHGNFNGNKVLSGNDVNVLNGNNTAVGVGILGTGAIALRK